MENLRGVKIVNQDSLMVENSHLYIKAKDENYCELTILDENSKKRKVGATWSSIIDKPTIFPPSTHTHSENEIKIIVGTSFASVGQYQRQFNQAVDDWKVSIQTQIDNLLNNKQNNLGYTPENISNKSDSYTLSSSTTYASSKALVDGLATKQDRLQDITGNIGIGKSDASATEKLDVNGNIKATGFKTPNGTPNKALTADGGTFDLNTKADLVGGKVPQSQLPSSSKTTFTHDILVSNWSLVSGKYEAVISNAGILSNSFVDVIPSNDHVDIVRNAQIYPSVLISEGSVKVYSKFLPSGTISVTVNII